MALSASPPTVATLVKDEQPSVDTSISWNDSPVEPSVHVRSIEEVLTVVAASPDGEPSTGAPTQAPTIAERSRRPPVTVLPTIDDVGATFASVASRRSWAVCPWLIEAQSAIAPDTWGVAIEVPLYEP